MAQQSSAGNQSSAASRREFLCTLGGIAGCAGLLPVATGCVANLPGEFSDVKAKPAAGGTFDFDLTDPKFADLKTVGKIVGFDAKPGLSLVLIRASDSQMLALSGACTHIGLSLAALGQFNPTTMQLTCIHAQSIFDKTGKVVSGPALGPLTAYAVTFANNKGTIAL